MEYTQKFTLGKRGLITKLGWFGNKLPIENCCLHFGYKARNERRNELSLAAKKFVQWAKEQPELKVEPCEGFARGVVRKSYRITLLPQKLQEVA